MLGKSKSNVKTQTRQFLMKKQEINPSNPIICRSNSYIGRFVAGDEKIYLVYTNIFQHNHLLPI